LGCLELARLGRPWLITAIVLGVFEVTVVLLLRAHYTIDVFAGGVAALWVGSIAPRLAAPVDARLDSWTKPIKPPVRSKPTRPVSRA
jgi:membrane-associated phospholipid phosphatase